MKRLLLIWCLMAGILLFCLMGVDKKRARKKGQRISERTLFAWALLGGAWGGTLGMFQFRHKTKHWYFRWGFPLLTGLEILFLLWLFLREFGLLS